jgi:hypothetical protein
MASTQSRYGCEDTHASRSSLPPERGVWGLALLVFGASFVLRFLDPGFTNDHFRLLAQARQILDGELPFRDFVDPGVFLQIQISALFQQVFGYRLLGEALLCIASLSAGYALTFALSARASGSLFIALVVTVLAIAMHPRLYAYDKVLLLPLGILVLWRYAERPTTKNLALLAVVTAIAFLVRHDHGVYIAAGAAATLAAVHGRGGIGPLLGRAAYCAAFGALPLLPFLVFLEANGGVAEYFGSAIAYTLERGEGKREVLDDVTAFNLDPADGPIRGGAPGLSLALGLVDPDNAVPWLYHLFLVLPVAAVAVLVRRRLPPRPGLAHMSAETPKILGAAVLCLAADRLLLRHPLDYRLADAAAPTAVIGAWLLGQWLVGRSRPATTDDREQPRPVVRAAVSAGWRWAVAAVVVGVTWLSIASVADVQAQLARIRLLDGPSAVADRATDVLDDLTTSPPIDAWASRRSNGFKGLVRYVHECTAPGDRLLVTWFAPDAYYYSGRGFAGGQLFWFSHWADSPEDERLILERLRQQSVPIVIARAERYSAFAGDYGLVGEHIAAHYRLAAESSFGGEEPYQVFVDRRLEPTGTYRPYALPCFR